MEILLHAGLDKCGSTAIQALGQAARATVERAGLTWRDNVERVLAAVAPCLERGRGEVRP